MKTLRKNNEFKRVKSSTKADWAAIKKLVEDGWKFINKTTWRHMRGDK